MSAQMRRPASVWIAQIIVLLVGIMFSLICVLVLIRELEVFANENVTAVQWLGLFVSVIFRIALVLLFVFSFWGLVKRRSYGRWLSVACISLFVLASFVGQFSQGPLERFEYKNSAELIGGIFGGLIIYGLFAFLLYRLAFGENVADFFRAEASESPADPPPPNAYFADENSE